MPSVTRDVFTGSALRLHLLELFLGATDMPDLVLPLAQAAEAWIAGTDLAEEPDVHVGGADVEPAEAAVAQGAGAPEGRRRGELKSQLLPLFEAGLEIHEIAAQLGIARGTVSSRAATWGLSAQWRAARERRRAEQTAASSVTEIVHIDPTADTVIPVTATVPSAARDVPPGSSWAFLDHSTQAELSAQPSRPPLAPPPEKSERERLIDDHARTKGVITKVDFGADQPAVDVLRDSYNDVVKSNDPRVPWLVNGARRTTQQLWDAANRERRQRGLKPIKRGA